MKKPDPKWLLWLMDDERETVSELRREIQGLEAKLERLRFKLQPYRNRASQRMHKG